MVGRGFGLRLTLGFSLFEFGDLGLSLGLWFEVYVVGSEVWCRFEFEGIGFGDRVDFEVRELDLRFGLGLWL